jgi:hypothetical protein
MTVPDGLLDKAAFYAPFPDELGRSVRSFMSLAGGEPPERDTMRRSFDRSQNPQRLADFANALAPYEGDPVLGRAVARIYAVVDTILLKEG